MTETQEMTHEEEKYEQRAEHARRRLIDALKPESEGGLHHFDLTQLAGFLSIMKNESDDMSTPVEAFITALVRSYVARRNQTNRLAPAEIQEHLDEMKLNFNDAIHIARKFTYEHPALVEKEELETGEEEE